MKSRIFLANFAPDDGQGATPIYNYTRTVALELIGIPAGTSSVTLQMINSSCANPKRSAPGECILHPLVAMTAFKKDRQHTCRVQYSTQFHAIKFSSCCMQATADE